MEDLRELWIELNHWWMWLLIAVIGLVELAVNLGWFPPEHLPPCGWFSHLPGC